MKKTGSLILSVLLMLSMLCGLTACGGNGGGADTIVGDWVCTMDMGAAFKEMVGMDLGKVELRLNFNFTEDEMTMAVDKEHFEAQIPAMCDAILSAMGEQMGIDAESFLAMSGMTKDQFIEQMKTELQSSTDSMKVEASYVTEDGKLYVMEDGETKEEAEPMNYEFKDGKLLLSTDDLEGAPEWASTLLPLTLERP